MRSPSLAGLVAVLLAALPAAADPAPPAPARIDFTDDEPDAPIEQITGAPPDVKHPTLLAGKYRGVADGNPDAIADPLADRAAPRPERPLWLGARVAGGMFDDDASAARAGLGLALAGRYRTGPSSFFAARVDWSRRGGDAMTGTIDVLGASAGLGVTIAGGLAVIGQLRSDLRLTDQRAGAAVRRTGLGLALDAEVALPATPFTAGVRIEQGLTDLVAGARDRAILAELGIDLR